MLKHPSLTLGRATLWYRDQLQPSLEIARAPLTVEFCPTAHPDQEAAERLGPWEPIESGFEWGPAYREAWFRIRGTVPTEWVGGEVCAQPEVGGERTLWVENVPECGIDREHPIVRLYDTCAGGESVTLTIQSHAGGNHIRVAGKVPPRLEKTEKVGACELVRIHTELQPLVYDVDFILSLLKEIPETDPGYSAILRALNHCCNLWAEEGDASIARCRKTLKDALGSLNSELKHTITPLGHAHLDTAWLWPLRITHLKMAHTASTQLRNMKRYPEYVYVHSQASQYEWIEKEYPALFKRIQAAAKEGQWETIGSMWVEADCNLTGAESLVRQFLYGRRYFKQHFSQTNEDMFLPDVFGYSAALPQILTKFGIQNFLTQKISWNQFNKFPHNTFWWQGIDGSRIWTHFPPADTYIGSCEPQEMIKSVRTHRDQARSDHSMYLFGWGDGGGGPTERHLELLRRARTAPYLPDIETRKHAVDFYKDAKAKSKDLATWVGELYLELHRGTYTSQAENKRANRECEFLMRDVELLACFQPDYAAHYPQEEIERLWKLVLLNQFHDIIPGSSVAEVYEDSDRDYAEIRAGARALIERFLKALAARMERPEGRPIAIFHNSEVPAQASLPWPHDAVPGSLEIGADRYPVQKTDDGQLIFDTPFEALGAVVVGNLSDAPPSLRSRLKVGPRKLENDEFSVKFDSQGNITSITSLDDNPIEFIASGSLANVFQLFDDRPQFWDAWDVDVYAYETETNLTRCDSFEVVERGPVRAAVEVVRRFGKSTIRQRISVGPTPGIRFDTWVDWHEDHKMLKVAFPMNVNTQRATFEIQFGHVERPTHSNTSWDLAKFEVCAQKWADLSEGGYGVALLNNGKYGHDVQGNTLRLSLLRSPKAPDPDCDMGEHFFSYVLLPHYDQVIHSQVVASSYAFNAEPRVVELEPGSGADGEVPPFVHVFSRSIVVESVKKAEDSDLIVVRLYECHNSRGTTEMSLATGVKRARLAMLDETPIADLELEDGVIRFDYTPFEILTFLIEV
ncbi:MAG: alpha-mannosidase [Chthonomonas sp.]|nr:alpha-mannosidase [Chthonomonas sp.]